MKKIWTLLAIGIVGLTSCDKNIDVTTEDKPLPYGTLIGTTYYVGDGTPINIVDWKLYNSNLGDIVITLANQINDCNLNPGHTDGVIRWKHSSLFVMNIGFKQRVMNPLKKQ